MPKPIRNEYYKKLSYESLMQAHLESRKGKSTRKEIIQFNLKQEEQKKAYTQIEQYIDGMQTTLCKNIL